METCKYGSGAGKRKPTAVKRKGVVCRAYRVAAKHAKQSVKPNAKPRKHAKKQKMKGTMPLPSRH